MPGPTNAKEGVQQMGKHLQLSRAQTVTFAAAAVAVFVVVFTIVAAKSLVGQSSFQSKVISAKKSALAQLAADQPAAKQLDNSYNTFMSSPQNLLGGSPSGTGPQDGDNATLVLQALPTKYDFPALASSLEKLITGQSMTIQSISGQDDELNQQSNTSSASPQTVPMPFSISASGSYAQVQSLVGQFEHSIRPFQIQTLELKGDQGNMTVSFTAQTYYQPAKSFAVRSKTIQ